MTTMRFATGCGRAAAVALLLAAGPGAAEVRRGLATTFAEALIEGVPIGSRFSLSARPVDILNKGDLPLRVRLSVVAAQPAEMRAGYEPAPETAWFSFDRKEIELKPGETGQAVLSVFVPDDPSLVGRRFQVMLDLASVPTEGSVVSVGLKPRLLLSVAPKAPGTDKAKVRLVMNPQVLARLTPFEAVGREPVLTLACGTVKAENPWDQPMTYEFHCDPAAADKVALKPHEVLIPDPSWIEVSPSVLVLMRSSRADAAVTARLPFDPKYGGRQYVAPLRTVARREGAEPVEMFTRVTLIVPSFTATGDEAARK